MEKVRHYSELIARYRAVAEKIGAKVSAIGSFDCPMGSYTLHKMQLTCGGGASRIVISTGMHGDEPAGWETLLLGLEEIGRRREEFNAEFIIFPCDNPTGYELNTRENWQKIDLNREFAKEGQAAEIAIIQQQLERQRLDFTLDIHEDVDPVGMYLYERTKKGRYPLAEHMIAALKNRGFPINEDDWIEGLPASGGIIWPSGRLRKFELPKAVYLWHQGCPHLVTTESPGKQELDTRIEMQMVCFRVFLNALAAGKI